MRALVVARDKLHTDVRTTSNIKSLQKMGYEVYAISALPTKKEIAQKYKIYEDCKFLMPSKSLLRSAFEFIKKGFVLRIIGLFFILFVSIVVDIFKKDFMPVVSIKLYIRLFGRILKENINYDLIIGQEIDGGLIGVSVKKRYGGKLAVDLHETYFSRLDHKSQISFLFKRTLLKFLVKNSEKQMVVSKGHLEFYKERNININAIVVPNLPMYEGEVKTHEMKEKIVFISQGSHRILNGIRYTNTDDLIKVWKEVKPQNAELILMHIDEKGKTPKEFLEQKNEFAKYNIIVKEPVKREEVVSVISNCDIGFYGYGAEMLEAGITKIASPNKIGEYLHAGLVLLAIDVSGFVKEIVQKYDCGFLFSNEEDLKQQIINITQNRNLIMLKKANLSNAVKHLNYFNFFKELQESIS